MQGHEITFRQIKNSDEEFLYQVFSNSLWDEMKQMGWTDEVKHMFARQQFQAQKKHFDTSYEGDDFLIILINENQAGRLYIGRWQREIRIIDIALLPEWRDQGIGAKLINSVKHEAYEAGKAVSIHVKIHSQALRLYKRLGFKKIEKKDIYWLMEWVPETKSEIQIGINTDMDIVSVPGVKKQ